MKQRDGWGLSAGPKDPAFEVLTTRSHTPPLSHPMLNAKPMEEWMGTSFEKDKFNVYECSILFIFLFPTCHALNTCFVLSWIKLFRNDLKENKNYFDLSGVDYTLVYCKHFWKGVVSRFALSFHVLFNGKPCCVHILSFSSRLGPVLKHGGGY